MSMVSSIETECSAPVTTIWGFLSQVLSEDHSCRDAVSRIIAHRAASGLKVCSPNTASYCNARARIPTAVLGRLAKQTAQQLQAGLPDGWRWNGRSVFIADGSHVSMPDTPENRAIYPQPVVQQPGIGFPLARVTVLLSLATGACHDLAIAPYAGKGTGETTLLRRMYDSLAPATWSWPTHCSTTTSSPANCGSSASSWSPVFRRSVWGAGRWRAGPTATSSSGSGPTSRAG